MPSPLVKLLTDKFFVYFARMHKYLLKLAIDINIKNKWRIRDRSRSIGIGGSLPQHSK